MYLIKNNKVLIFGVIALTICFYLISNFQNTEDFANKKVIARIDNIEIRQRSIDSLLSDQLYALRSSKLDEYLADELIKKECEKHNMDYEGFYQEYILKRIKIPDEEIVKFLNDNPSLSNDFVKAQEYLRHIKMENIKRSFVDSVSQYYIVEKFLRPDYFQRINAQKVFGFNLSEINENRMNVFIISNPHCPACNDVFEDFRLILDKYKHKVNFKFVYLDSYFNDDAIIFAEANKQGKFARLYKRIHENPDALDSISVLFDLAKKSGINMSELENGFNNTDINKLLKTRDFLFENKIFETPVFIVNNLVLKEPDAIYYLENVIHEEIQKY